MSDLFYEPNDLGYYFIILVFAVLIALAMINGLGYVYDTAYERGYESGQDEKICPMVFVNDYNYLETKKKYAEEMARIIQEFDKNDIRTIAEWTWRMR